MALVKVGTYEGDFLAEIKKYNPDFFTLPGVLSSVNKYGAVIMQDESKVLLSVSHSPTNVNRSYNVIVHSGSKNAVAAMQVLRDFQEKTDIKLREAPGFIHDTFDSIEKLIEVHDADDSRITGIM